MKYYTNLNKNIVNKGIADAKQADKPKAFFWCVNMPSEDLLAYYKKQGFKVFAAPWRDIFSLTVQWEAPPPPPKPPVPPPDPLTDKKLDFIHKKIKNAKSKGAKEISVDVAAEGGLSPEVYAALTAKGYKVSYMHFRDELLAIVSWPS